MFWFELKCFWFTIPESAIWTQVLYLQDPLKLGKYVCVLIEVCALWVQCIRRPEEHVRTPEARISGAHEPSNVLGTNLGSSARLGVLNYQATLPAPQILFYQWLIFVVTLTLFRITRELLRCCSGCVCDSGRESHHECKHPHPMKRGMGRKSKRKPAQQVFSLLASFCLDMSCFALPGPLYSIGLNCDCASQNEFSLLYLCHSGTEQRV